MKAIKKFKKGLGKVTVLIGILMITFTVQSFAHCDSFDGPVIQEALKALDKEDVTPLMKWIEEKHEEEIRNLFAKTVALKKGDAEIYSIVEMYFLETLVRVHREGEGAPYTGLKPAGSVTPFVRLADRSIEDGDLDHVLSNVGSHIRHALADKFAKVRKLSEIKDRSVEDGRAYVAAYVEYTHTLEGIEEVLMHGGHH